MDPNSASAEDQRPGILVENERGTGGGGSEDPSNQRVNYTIPGVLHFLQTECARMEAERAQFELERTEFQARIAFLEGERRAQDNLKKDLVRRIRMLEHALAKERERAAHTNSSSGQAAVDNDENRIEKSDHGDMTQIGLSTQPVEDLEELLQNLGQTKNQKARAQMITEGRQLLRKYLQEIGYADTIVDVRSARVRALLGLENGQLNSSRTPGSANLQNGSSTSPLPLPPAMSNNQTRVSTVHEKSKIPDDVINSAEQSVLDTFAFLRSSELSGNDDSSGDSLIPELKKVYRVKRDDVENSDKPEDRAALAELTSLLHDVNVSSNTEAPHRISDLDSMSAVNEADEIGEGMGRSDSSLRNSSQHQQLARPEIRFALRSHYDAIRSIAFHPTEAAIVSASDDTTVKIWSLDRQNIGTAASTSPQIRRGNQSLPSSVVSDLEPIQTFRSHCAPVLCTTLGSAGDRLYTGSLDGSLACFSLHSMFATVTDIYDPWDSSRSLAYVPLAHNDAIWQVAAHPTRHSLLASCGADGAVRLWNVGDDQAAPDADALSETIGVRDRCSPVLLRTMTVNDKTSFGSVDFSRNDYTQVIASSSMEGSTSSVFVFDFETGAVVARVENICSSINEVVSHPTLPLVALACDDGFIRVVDVAAATAVFPASPVLDAVVVATLPTPAPVSSIAIDHTGVYLLAGCHDGSIRLWNLETRACLFDDTVAHHKKFDEGVLSVAIHPSRPLFASAGADGAVRIYRW